jgi:hypothetical protein
LIIVFAWGCYDRLDEYRRAFFSAALIGESMITGAEGFLYLFLNMDANVVSDVIVSSPIVEKVTSGWGSFRASFMSWAAIRSLYVEEICGIGELRGKKSKVSTMPSLAVNVIYTF